MVPSGCSVQNPSARSPSSSCRKLCACHDSPCAHDHAARPLLSVSNAAGPLERCGRTSAQPQSCPPLHRCTARARSHPRTQAAQASRARRLSSQWSGSAPGWRRPAMAPLREQAAARLFPRCSRDAAAAACARGAVASAAPGAGPPAASGPAGATHSIASHREREGWRAAEKCHPTRRERLGVGRHNAQSVRATLRTCWCCWCSCCCCCCCCCAEPCSLPHSPLQAEDAACVAALHQDIVLHCYTVLGLGRCGCTGAWRRSSLRPRLARPCACSAAWRPSSARDGGQQQTPASAGVGVRDAEKGAHQRLRRRLVGEEGAFGRYLRRESAGCDHHRLRLRRGARRQPVWLLRVRARGRGGGCACATAAAPSADQHMGSCSACSSQHVALQVQLPPLRVRRAIAGTSLACRQSPSSSTTQSFKWTRRSSAGTLN